MALPGVEITITLDGIDAETQSGQPQVVMQGAQSATAGQGPGQERKNRQQQLEIQTQQGDSTATEQSQETQSAQHGQSGSNRPKLLPFLGEIRSRKQTGVSKRLIISLQLALQCF